MNTQSRVRARLAMFATGLAIAAAGTLVGASVASAHHSDLQASASCNSTVSWTANAWSGYPDNPDSRTHTNVVITYKVDGAGDDVPVATGQYTSSNSFSLSGQFAYPSGASFIVLRVMTIGVWGDGDGPGAQTSVTVNAPQTPCETTTTVEEEEETTTTVAETTTTIAATTTTEVGSEGPTTTVAGPTTTEVASGGPTTTLVAGELPRTGGGDADGSLLLVACGLLLMGGSIMMTVRRRPA